MSNIVVRGLRTAQFVIRGLSADSAATITPAVGALGLSGLTPVIGASGVKTPTTGVLSFTTLAPVVGLPGFIRPSVGSLALIQIAPTVSNTVNITLDATSSSAYQTAKSVYSWSHTCTGTNRYLLVGISILQTATVMSITYNGVSMGLLRGQTSVANAIRAELWGLVAPATGLHSIVVTLDDIVDSVGSATSYTGVDQTIPTESANSATATNSGVADDATVITTTVANNDWVIDVVATNDTSIAVGLNHTSRVNVAGALGSGGMSTRGPVSPPGPVT